ncbi:MAG: hypothetical protein SPL47_09050 [Bacteroidales bacterium]|nr:hypothetical protein [Bacteroidales bacterium]
MLKKIFSAAVIVCTFAFNAQAQKWEHFVTEADELIGETGHESDMYTDETGNVFVMWSDESENFRVISGTSIFNFVGDIRSVMATIGYYDMNNKLIEKNDIQLLVSEGQANQAEPNMIPMIRPFPNKKRVKMLLDYVQNKQGYVRIIAPLYGTNAKFDIKIPCLKNPKPTE